MLPERDGAPAGRPAPLGLGSRRLYMECMTSCREAPVQAAEALSRRSISSSFRTASFLLGSFP